MTSGPLSPASLRNSQRALARALSLVENNHPAAGSLLRQLVPDEAVPVIGITGPPGAGKSSLLNEVAAQLVSRGKRVAILAVDPTSPFTFGALLGDRIRMSGSFDPARVFIRSLATRGSLGGVSAKTQEMLDVLRSAGFDLVFVETVGVGQSEVEIAGLADHTLVVLVPGTGDEVQLIKSGIMEIADTFVVGKSDLPGAKALATAIKKLMPHDTDPPVFEVSANSGSGIPALTDRLLTVLPSAGDRRTKLLVLRAWRLLEEKRMRTIDRARFAAQVNAASAQPGFNLYRFVEDFSE